VSGRLAGIDLHFRIHCQLEMGAFSVEVRLQGVASRAILVLVGDRAVINLQFEKHERLRVLAPVRGNFVLHSHCSQC
jgi:hypothetical protein